MSTAVWFSNKSLMDYLKTYDPSYKLKWYLDVGTQEVENPNFNRLYLEGNKQIYDQLKALGLEEANLEMVIEEDGIHNEDAWARRLPNALRWLFK